MPHQQEQGRRIGAADILQHMEVPGEPGLLEQFIAPTLARKLSVLTQELQDIEKRAPCPPQV